MRTKPWVVGAGTLAAGGAAGMAAGAGWGAAAAMGVFGAALELGEVKRGASWADVVSRHAREALAAQPMFTAPDGTRPRIDSWAEQGDGIVIAEGWAGVGAHELSEWVERYLPAAVNERNRLRVTLSSHWAVGAAWVDEDPVVKGRVTLHMRRDDPLTILRPWPGQPGETPMSSFIGDWAIGYDRRGLILTAPFWGAESPHILLAGSPGSGKSNLINLLMLQLIGLNVRGHRSGRGPEVFIVGCDFKQGMELGPYRDAMSLVITDPKQAIGTFRWLRRVLEARGYRLAAGGEQKPVAFGPGQCGVALVIDEASLLDKAALEELNKLAAIGRALGLVILMCTQYPLAKTFEGLSKPNFGVRISCRLEGGISEAKVILGEHPALTATWGPHVRSKDPRYAGTIYADFAEGLNQYKAFYVDRGTRDAGIDAGRGTAPGPEELEVSLGADGNPHDGAAELKDEQMNGGMPKWFANVVETTATETPKPGPSKARGGRRAKTPA